MISLPTNRYFKKWTFLQKWIFPAEEIDFSAKKIYVSDPKSTFLQNSVFLSKNWFFRGIDFSAQNWIYLHKKMDFSPESWNFMQNASIFLPPKGFSAHKCLHKMKLNHAILWNKPFLTHIGSNSGDDPVLFARKSNFCQKNIQRLPEFFWGARKIFSSQKRSACHRKINFLLERCSRFTASGRLANTKCK